MKRSAPPKRRTFLSRSGPPKRANPKRQAKRRKTYAQKLAAYRRSETYKIVEERASGRCERITMLLDWMMQDSLDGYPRMERFTIRCGEREGLSHHHRTYSRLGGAELPEDMEVLCRYHHALAEAEHPNRRNNHRKAS